MSSAALFRPHESINVDSDEWKMYKNGYQGWFTDNVRRLRGGGRVDMREGTRKEQDSGVREEGRARKIFFGREEEWI